MALYLESLDEDGQSWLLAPGSGLLGRGNDCDIQLDDLRLSRHHARYEVEHDRITIFDLGSTNGVLVNGDPVQGSRALILNDIIVMGPRSFRLRCISDSSSQPSPPQPTPQPPAPAASAPPASSRRKRSTSEEFAPSTDRSLRKTQDMDEPRVETPVARPNTAPESIHRTGEASAALTERRVGRRLASDIERALEAQEQGLTPPPPTTPARHKDTDVLQPSPQNKGRKSDALLPLDDRGRPMRNPEAQLSVTPLSVREPDYKRLLLAAILDYSLIALGAMLLLMIGAGLGWWLATMADPESQALDFERHALIQRWHHQGHVAWLGVLSGHVLGAGAAFAWAIWMLIGRTTLYGAPPVQQYYGYVLIQLHSGHFPSPGTVLKRSLVAILAAPWTVMCALMGRPGIHDQLTGCRMQQRA
ncbi:MAG: FHA domain-containing protein [Planctomycetota bacterium]|nr:MAG: FHA domain-containing protein [Planctomycetota bacterium]